MLCRAFDTDAIQEFHEWYKPTDWLWWGRGLGAFIYRKFAALRGPPLEAPGEPTDFWWRELWYAMTVWSESKNAERKSAWEKVQSFIRSCRLASVPTPEPSTAALDAAYASLKGPSIHSSPKMRLHDALVTAYAVDCARASALPLVHREEKQ